MHPPEPAPLPNDRINAEQLESALEDIAWAIRTYYAALLAQGLPGQVALILARDYQQHLFSSRS